MISYISVVIPVYNAELTLDKCLQSLANQSMRGFELVVVDNNSTDSSMSIVKTWLDKFPVPIRIVHEQKKGAAAARNHGVRVAKGKWIAFTDADCEPDADWLKTGESLIEKYSPEALAGSAWGGLQEDESAKLLGLTTLSVGLEQHWRDNVGKTGVNGFATANFWIKKTCFNQLQGFDEQLHISGEDYDLCARIYKQGKRILYSPDLRVRHTHPEGVLLLLTKAASYGRAHGYLFQQYGEKGMYLDFLRGKQFSFPIRHKIWVNLVSAEKKALFLCLLGFVWPIFWVLFLGYPYVLGHFLNIRAKQQGTKLGGMESYFMGCLMIMRSAAFTIGRVQGSKRMVWVA